jgi:hypothetical protein
MAKPDPKSRLSQLLAQLPEAQQNQLLEFAEFLAERHPPQNPVSTEPIEIERPENETVVSAMKRLRESYPMLDPEKLLHETSTLMSAHLMQGKPADEIIDELERVFRRHYEAFRSGMQ